jgi:hypothetical protein
MDCGTDGFSVKLAQVRILSDCCDQATGVYTNNSVHEWNGDFAVGNRD